MRKTILFSIGTLIFCLTASTAFSQVTVTKRDTLIYDPNNNDAANPGDSLRYKTKVKNPGAGNVTGATMDVNPSANLGPATNFRTTPVAVNDTFDVTANIGITVDSTNGLKPNDFDDDYEGTALLPEVKMSTMGGDVTINADGSFSYVPNDGFTGADNFTYTLLDGNEVLGCPPANNAIVLLNVAAAPMIWFIDNTGGGSGGDGRVNTPFKTLADFNSASGPQPGHTVFIEYTGMNYPGGIVLEDNQILWGTGHTGGSNLADLIVEAPFSLALPPINGSRPTITNTGGDGVTLAGNNSLRGFRVGACSDFGIENGGNNSVGVLVVSEVSIVNTTGGGFDASHTSSVGMNVVFDTTSSTGGANGVNLNNCVGIFNGGVGTMTSPNGIVVNIVAGTVGFTYSGNITQANNFAMVSVSNGHNTGTVTFQTGMLNATNGTGLQFDNADSPTSYNFNGPVSLNGGSAGIDIVNGSVGSFTFSNCTILNPSGDAVEITGSNATVSFNGKIKDNAGYAIDIDNHDANTVTFAGDSLVSTGTGVRITNSNGGTVNFNHTVKMLTTATSNAVDLTANGSGTMNFGGGGLAISTTSGTGFNATGGAAAVNVTGTGNTISSGTGTALNVNSTTIGISNLNFRSISSSGGTATGIILDNTGTSGGLIVNGDGSNTALGGNSSGGTISYKKGTDGMPTTGCGIYLNNTSNVILRRMTVNDTIQNYGIRAISVNNFILEYSTVSGIIGNSITADVEAGPIVGGEGTVRFSNLTGSATVNSCLIGGANKFIFRVNNTAGTLNRITISNSTIGDIDAGGPGYGNTVADGDDALHIEAKGNAVVNATIQNCIFNQAKGDIFQLAVQHISTVDLIMRGNSISNNHTNIVSGLGGITIGATSQADGTSNLTYDISCNKFQGAVGNAMTLFKGGVPMTNAISNMTGTVFNNKIGVSGVVGSGSIAASGIQVDAQGHGTHTVLIKNNIIYRYATAGISMQSGDGDATLHATVVGNFAAEPGPFGLAGFYAESGALGTDAITLNLKLGGAGAEQNNFVDGDPFNSADVLYSRIAPSVFNLSQGVSGSMDPVVITQANNVAPITVGAVPGILAVPGNPANAPIVDQTCIPPL